MAIPHASAFLSTEIRPTMAMTGCNKGKSNTCK
uniref:Uncharacterized protein n=1 Tax=Anguilla anguilla TaxID=7936 RepID=A0A0E9PYK8_ANGAN